MFAIPFKSLMALPRLQPHQLLRDEVLVEVVGDMWEDTVFVSHEWLGWDHPDPDNEQFLYTLACE